MIIPEPQSRFVQVGDLNLHYLEWGAVGETPLVMLHGWGDTAWLYKRFGRLFEMNYHLFSLDLRGHGKTGGGEPPNFSQRVLLNDLEQFLEALDLTEIILVGYSFGGTIAHRFVGAHPERVKALCIIDIGVDNVPGTFNPNNTPEIIQASIVRAWERFQKIECPTLIIKAENSHLLNLESAKRMAEIIPRGKLVVIKDSDHKVFRAHLEMGKALSGFLKDEATSLPPL